MSKNTATTPVRPFSRLTSASAAALILVGLSALTGACDEPVDDDLDEEPEGFAALDGGDEPANDHKIEERLYALSSKIWTTLSIPVCWQGVPASQATERGWVRAQVEATWEKVTYVDFTGWGACTNTAKGIRILVADAGPHTKGLGIDLDGKADGMVLNFTFNNWSPSCKDDRESCIRSIAAHEFGHALGFAHEHNRPDRPVYCKDAAQGTDGDVTLGLWDLQSIMNYCNTEWNNGGALSAGDIAGARQFYGSPTFAPLARDAIDLDNGNGKVYFFNGSQYTRYDRAADRADSGYPKPIVGNWKDWPASVTKIDAALRLGKKAYFFTGDSYIRFDIPGDRVDQLPKKIAAGWSGWPQTWTSVDAAVDLGKGKAYFFRGSQYIRFDIATDKVDQAPKTIAGNWSGVFTSNIDYALNYGDGKVYFFRGTEYQRFDIAADKVDPGYPRPIVGNWAGVPF